MSTSENEHLGDPVSQLRRDLLSAFCLLLALGASSLVAAPVIGFLLAPFMRPKPRLWRPVGRLDDFRVGETVEVKITLSNPLPWDGFLAETAAWLRRESEGFLIASTTTAETWSPARHHVRLFVIRSGW